MNDANVFEGLHDEKTEAARIGFSVKKLRAWRFNKSGPPFRKIGYFVRYKQDEVDAWIKDMERAKQAKSAQAILGKKAKPARRRAGERRCADFAAYIKRREQDVCSELHDYDAVNREIQMQRGEL
jgi:hypothetical protein